MASLQEGGARPLTIGEIALARSVFGDAIKYSEVKVHNKSYLPFNMQSTDVAMTPNGELYFREPHYRDDFSIEVPRYKHWFIHEMVHVLQHQIGMNVRTRGHSVGQQVIIILCPPIKNYRTLVWSSRLLSFQIFII